MVFFLLRWWAPFVTITGTALGVLSLGPARTVVWDDAGLAFIAVLALTALCAVGRGHGLDDRLQAASARGCWGASCGWCRCWG